MTDPAQSHPLHPSKKAILKATTLALIVASVILVFVILPAEYGIDITGAGKALGLTNLAKDKNAKVSSVSVNKPETAKWLEHSTKITLQPRQGQEYKFKMEEGAGMLYTWKATAPLHYEFHGEPQDGPAGYFQSYEKKDEGEEASGSFTAPFTGRQGWYWENRSNEPITITLTTVGFYTVIGDPKKLPPQ